MKFRKKPVVIEAVQFTGENHMAIAAQLLREGELRPFTEPYGMQLFIATREGTMAANVGDWIIRGVAGEFYPVKPDIFAATYEQVDPEGAPQ